MLPRTTLHSQIADLLRDMVVGGALEPGRKVPEKELCERFGISRTPFREALRVLAAEGLIELLPQRGARVVTITDEELSELFPIIGAMEELSGQLACQNATDAELSGIAAAHAEMIDAYRKGDHMEYARLNRGIHLSILAAGRNGSLATFYSNLEMRIRNIRHTVRQTDADWARAVREHEEILAALLARDGQRCGALLREHVTRTADSVRRSLPDLYPERKAGSEA